MSSYKLTLATFMVAVYLQLLLPVAGFAATITSTNSGGSRNWTDTLTWVGNSVPVNGDDIIILSGTSVTIDTNLNLQSLTIIGTLTFQTIARSVAISGNVFIDNTGVFQTNSTGTTSITHTLYLNGNLTNNGKIDFFNSVSNNGTFTFKTRLFFIGNNDVTFITGLNSYMDFPIGGIILEKDSIQRVVAFNPGNDSIWVDGKNPNNSTVAGFLSVSATSNIVAGTFKITGSTTVSHPVIAAANYKIIEKIRFWLDNSNFTVTGQDDSPSVSGTLHISNGTFKIGTIHASNMKFLSNSTIIIEGGNIYSTARFGVNSNAANLISYKQTGGTVTVNTYSGTISGSGYAGFDLGTNPNSKIILTGGKVVIQTPNSSPPAPNDKDFRGPAINANVDITDNFTLQFSNDSISSAKTYYIQGIVPKFSIYHAQGVTGHTLKLSGTTQFNFDANINSGDTLHINTNSATFLKNLTNNGIIRSESGGKLAFAGTSAQNVSGGGAYYNAATGTTPIGVDSLTINNSAGVTFAHDMQINNTFTQTAGIVNMSSNTLTIGYNSTNTNNWAYNAGHVVGKVKRWFGTTISNSTFYLGTATTQRNASLAFSGNTITAGGTITAEFKENTIDATDLPRVINGQTIDAVSPTGYWEIEAGDGLNLGSATYTATFDATGFTKTNGSTPITNVSSVCMIKRPTLATTWGDVGATASTTIPSALNAVSIGEQSTFSIFALGGMGAALPVELIDFKGVAHGKQNIINWSTASEKDTKCFILERRNNYEDFKSLGLVAATGQSNQPQFYQWVDQAPIPFSMYRLKIMDWNGSYEYSKVISVENAGGNAMTIMPNFTNDGWSVRLTNVPIGAGTISIFDMQGKLQYIQSIDVQNIITDVKLSINNLPNGSYILVCNVGGQILSKKWIKI